MLLWSVNYLSIYLWECLDSYLWIAESYIFTLIFPVVNLSWSTGEIVQVSLDLNICLNFSQKSCPGRINPGKPLFIPFICLVCCFIYLSFHRSGSEIKPMWTLLVTPRFWIVVYLALHLHSFPGQLVQVFGSCSKAYLYSIRSYPSLPASSPVITIRKDTICICDLLRVVITLVSQKWSSGNVRLNSWRRPWFAPITCLVYRRICFTLAFPEVVPMLSPGEWVGPSSSWYWAGAAPPTHFITAKLAVTTSGGWLTRDLPGN